MTLSVDRNGGAETTSSPLQSAGTASAVSRAAVPWVLVSVVIGVAVAVTLVSGEQVALAFAVISVVILYAVGVAVSWSPAILLIVGYAVVPTVADNVFPQIAYFPATDVGVTPREVVVIGDLVLAGLLGRELWRTRPSRREVLWPGLLVGLAFFGVVRSLQIGAAPAVAIVGTASFVLRGALIALLFALLARRQRAQQLLLQTLPAVAAAACFLAAQAIAIDLIYGTGSNFVGNAGGGSFQISFGGRPRLPGWGNNMASNAILVGYAVVVTCGRWLRWPLAVRIAAIGVLLAGLMALQTRMTMLAAVVLGATHLSYWYATADRPPKAVWLRRSLAAVAGVVMVSAALAALAAVNPRFESLLPTGGESASPRSPSSSSDRDSSVAAPPAGAGSFETRGALTSTALELAERRPVAGHGWASWGWLKEAADPRLVAAIDPHSGLLWLLVESGVVGVLLIYGAVAAATVATPLGRSLLPVVSASLAVELLNPNLQNAHYSVFFWPLAALVVSSAVAPTRS